MVVCQPVNSREAPCSAFVSLAAPDGVAARAQPCLRSPPPAWLRQYCMNLDFYLCCEGQNALDCSLIMTTPLEYRCRSVPLRCGLLPHGGLRADAPNPAAAQGRGEAAQEHGAPPRGRCLQPVHDFVDQPSGRPHNLLAPCCDGFAREQRVQCAE